MSYSLVRSVQLHAKSRYWGDCGQYSDTTVPYAAFQVKKIGSRVPKYKWRIENMLDASSAYERASFGYSRQGTYEVGIFDNGYGQCRFFRTTVFAASNATNPIPPPVTANKAFEIAARRFASKLQSERVRWQGSVAAVEIKKTRQMVADATTRLFDAVVDAGAKALKIGVKGRRGRWSKRNIRRAISSNYLEAVFGWGPLIQDIEDGFAAIDHQLRKQFTVTGSGKWSSNHPFQQHHGYAYSTVFENTQEIRESRVRITAGYDTTTWLPDRYGFSVVDMPLTLWEVTPWSFLLDYFLPIDDFLTSVMNVFLTPIYCVQTEKRVKKVSSTFRPVPRNIYVKHQLALSGHWQSKSTWVTRAVLPRPPIVSPFRLCGPVSGGKLLNIAALLNQSRDFRSF